MIYLTKTDYEKARFLLNHRLIERIERTNDTIILLEGGKKLIVNETPDEIREKIIEFEAEIIVRSKRKKDVNHT